MEKIGQNVIYTEFSDLFIALFVSMLGLGLISSCSAPQSVFSLSREKGEWKGLSNS